MDGVAKERQALASLMYQVMSPGVMCSGDRKKRGLGRDEEGGGGHDVKYIKKKKKETRSNKQCATPLRRQQVKIFGGADLVTLGSYVVCRASFGGWSFMHLRILGHKLRKFQNLYGSDSDNEYLFPLPFRGTPNLWVVAIGGVSTDCS